MVLSSLAEVISIGAVLPFIGALSTPETVFQLQYMQPLFKQFNLTSSSQIILPLTIVFISAAIFAGAIRLLLLYVMTRLSYATGADFSIDIYRRTLFQDYSVHVARNSSEVINGIITKTNMVTSSIISPVLNLISSAFLLVGIVIALFTIDVFVALTALLGFGTLYLVVYHYTRKQLKVNSQCVADQSTQVIKSLQEGLGGIRDVLIDGSQQFYCDLYQSADLPLRRASGNNVFIGSSPKYIMEALGMALIAGLAFVMTKQAGGVATAIPILAALALGAQRLLPTLQLAYFSYSSLKGSKASFEDVLDLLDQPLPIDLNQPQTIQMPFKNEIRLSNLSFRYSIELPLVLDKINLIIPKGSRIGFKGTTGSGKSTLIDVIMGLLQPTEGKLFIDDEPITPENRRGWQTRIAHVPQNVYLSDSTIEENIAFGIQKDQIDLIQVQKAAKQAQLADLIEGWPKQYKTYVGERGIRLSGGQRQRIGIARALYKQADVLIFDEATSALDNETEGAVMDAIDGLGRELTILIIAHRLTTLKGCSQVINLSLDGLTVEEYTSDLN
jgi:ATP-binding cassette, subfamily B, bacterial PglK